MGPFGIMREGAHMYNHNGLRQPSMQADWDAILYAVVFGKNWMMNSDLTILPSRMSNAGYL